MNASIFSDDTDCSQDDNDDGIDDNERIVKETNRNDDHKDEDKEAWLIFLEEQDEMNDGKSKNSNQEEIFTQDMN